jgi:tetratricopeptide (TPR) repeat protein
LIPVFKSFLQFVIFVTLIVIPFFTATELLYADTAADLLNSAKQLYNQQKYEQSRVALDDFLRLYPSHVLTNEAKFYLADSYLYLKKYDTAINLYSQLSTLPSTDPLYRTILFRLGEAYYTKGDYTIAKNLLTNFLQTLPNDSYLQYVLYYLGDVEIANNNASLAEYYFRENIRIFPSGGRLIESKIGLAIAENLLGEIAKSDAIFNELLSSTDQNILEPTTYQYGVALHERGENQSAINTLNNFLSRWQNSTLKFDVLRVLTRCYISLKDNDKALQTISNITSPSVDDNLMKIRLFIRLRQSDEAENLLMQTEKRADAPPHADEIAFLKSVLQYFKKNWQNTITLLEQFLLPKYSTQNNPTTNSTAYTVNFGYSTTITRTDRHNLSDEVFLHACAYLALAYARAGNKNKADAIINEMNGFVANTNQAELTKVVNDTHGRLTRIYTTNTDTSTNNNDTLVTLNSGGQWSPSTASRSRDRNKPPAFTNIQNSLSYNSNGNRTPNFDNLQQNAAAKQPVTTGTDTDRFWIAFREFEKREWNNAAAQLDQILQTNYFEQTKYITIGYVVGSTTDKLSADTFAKACSMLAISRANLGEIDKASAILAAFASKLDTTNTVQQGLLRETESQLANIIRNNNSNTGTNTNGNFAQQISETEQRRIIKECNSLFNSRRYEQVNEKLQVLLQMKLSDEILPEVLLLRSKTLIAVGNEREGIKLLERIRSEFVSSVQYKDSLWNLGFYYEMSGDSVKSAEYFQILIDEFPNYKNIDGALYYVALGELDGGDSRNGISRLLRIYRNYQVGQYWSHAVWTLAYEEYKKKNYSQAEIYLQKALLHPPDYAILDRVLYLKGEIAMQRREYKIAVLAFQEVINLCPDSQLIQNANRNLQTANRAANNIR